MPAPPWTRWRLWAELALPAVVLCWSLIFAFTKLALLELDPLAFTGGRFAAMGLLALVTLYQQGRLRAVFGPDLPRFALSGLTGYTLYQLGFILGIERTSAFSSALLLGTIPLFSLLFLTLLRLERVTRSQWLGVLVAVAGLGLFVGGKGRGGGLPATRWGDLLSLGAAVSFAWYGILNKPLLTRHRPSTVLAGSLLLGSIPLVLIGLPAITQQAWAALSLRAWLIWGYAVIFPIYLAYIWWNAAIARKGVGAVTSYCLLVPPVSGLFSYAWLGEAYGAGKLAASALVLLGLAWSRGWLPGLSSSGRAPRERGC